MSCRCFTCQIHREKTIPHQYKLLAECVYYASCAKEQQYTLNLLKKQGFKTGHLTDEGIEGEMAAIEFNLDADVYALQELVPQLSVDYARFVRAIYDETKGSDNVSK